MKWKKLLVICSLCSFKNDEILFEREKFKNISAELDRTLDDLNGI